jgi:hypothetical protein
MMFRPQYRFPIITGDILAAYRAGLTAWSSLDCAPTRPKDMPKRLLTLREDGGPDNGTGLGLWGYGVNLWADSAVDAKNIALDAAAVSLTLAGTSAIKAVRDLVGPYEVEDDPAYTFAGNLLTHFYFSFDATVKARAV